MDKGGRHEKKSDGDSEKSDEQRKKSPGKQNSAFLLLRYSNL